MAAKPPSTWIGSPNYGYPSGAAGRQGQKPIALVYHVMEGTLAGTDSWFKSARSGASTHYGIGKNGEIHQYVSLDNAAWGNGLMNNPDLSIQWLKQCWDTNLNPNLLTVSIEHEGAHERDPGGAISAFWEPTEAQYQASLALTRWLCEELQIPVHEDHLIGHGKIDSMSRANCPGPGFPFQRLLADLRPPAWDPAVEIARLRERGIINSPHDPGEALTWGTFSTVLNRVLDRIEGR